MLIVIELSNATQRMTWQINEGISSAETETIASHAIRFVAVTPNPAREIGAIAFTTSGVGAVRLDLFDMSGERVRTIVDGEHLSRGTHRRSVDLVGLAAGHHLARLTEGDASATHLVVVE
jgi:hypothetical protein